MSHKAIKYNTNAQLMYAGLLINPTNQQKEYMKLLNNNEQMMTDRKWNYVKVMEEHYSHKQATKTLTEEQAHKQVDINIA